MGDGLELSDRFLTTEEVAAVTRFTVPTIRTWILRGELEACQIGRIYRVRWGDLQSFLGKRRVTVAKEGNLTPRREYATIGINRERRTRLGD